jgi:Protein of unknown function (DUF642)/PEP-CTERM motif
MIMDRKFGLIMAASVTLAASSLVSSSYAANLLVNGDFESTNNGFSETETPVGWTNIGHIDGVIAYSIFNTPAYNGSYFYDEGGYGDPGNAPGDGIEQTVATAPGQTYTLTFGLSSENVSGTEIADVMIGSQLTQYTLDVDGSFGEIAKPFTTYTISYLATSAFTTIAFTTDALSPSFGNNDPLVDGISFSGSTGATPEPSTWAMMIVGFVSLGLAGLRHSRKARQAAAAV